MIGYSSVNFHFFCLTNLKGFLTSSSVNVSFDIIAGAINFFDCINWGSSSALKSDVAS